jgi:hypothetical protein
MEMVPEERDQPFQNGLASITIVYSTSSHWGYDLESSQSASDGEDLYDQDCGILIS